MARGDRFSGLDVFLAVAEQSSFRAAAAQLGVTRAAVSQAVKALELRLGQSLVSRTTRSLSLTEAGRALAAATGPAADDIQRALDAVAARGDAPSGHLRLSVPRIAIDLFLAEALAEFRRAYPAITVETVVEDASVDLVANGLDAGIRFGDFIDKDLKALKLTSDMQWVVVASPDYLARHGPPSEPAGLMTRDCIGYRYPSAATLHRWEFIIDGRRTSLAPRPGLTVNDHLTMIALARRGAGFAYTVEPLVAEAVAAGALVRVLEGFVPAGEALYLYYPASSALQPKMEAFIGIAKRVRRGRLG